MALQYAGGTSKHARQLKPIPEFVAAPRSLEGWAGRYPCENLSSLWTLSQGDMAASFRVDLPHIWQSKLKLTLASFLTHNPLLGCFWCRSKCGLLGYICIVGSSCAAKSAIDVPTSMSSLAVKQKLRA